MEITDDYLHYILHRSWLVLIILMATCCLMLLREHQFAKYSYWLLLVWHGFFCLCLVDPTFYMREYALMLLFDSGIRFFNTDLHVELVFLLETLVLQFGLSLLYWQLGILINSICCKIQYSYRLSYGLVNSSLLMILFHVLNVFKESNQAIYCWDIIYLVVIK